MSRTSEPADAVSLARDGGFEMPPELLEVYRKRFWMLVAVASQILGSGGDPEGVVQTAFLKATQRWLSFKQDKGTVETWVRKIVENQAKDDRKRMRRRREVSGHDELGLQARLNSAQDFYGHDPIELVHEMLGWSSDSHRRILEARLAGNSAAVACEAGGIHRRGLTRAWNQIIPKMIKKLAPPSEVELRLALFEAKTKPCPCRIQRARAELAKHWPRQSKLPPLEQLWKFWDASELTILAKNVHTLSDKPCDTLEGDHERLGMLTVFTAGFLARFRELRECPLLWSAEAEAAAEAVLVACLAVHFSWEKHGWGHSQAHEESMFDFIAQDQSEMLEGVLSLSRNARLRCVDRCKSIIVEMGDEEVHRMCDWRSNDVIKQARKIVMNQLILPSMDLDVGCLIAKW